MVNVKGHNVQKKQNLVKRLARIEGQVRGLVRMVEEGVYCVDIITQTSAVRSALSGVEDALMQEHLSTCVVEQMKKGKEGKAISEILKVYGLKRK